MTVAAGYRMPRRPRPGIVGPFYVRVVDAQEKPACRRSPSRSGCPTGRSARSRPTHDGRVVIPAGAAVEGAVLSAARGKEALAWARVGDAAARTTGPGRRDGRS